MSDDKANGGRWKTWMMIGCMSPFALLVALFFFLAVWFFPGETVKTTPGYIKSAETTVQKIKNEILGKKTRTFDKNKTDYDLDQTAMTLYSIEKAMKEAKNFEDLTSFILTKDSDLVPPDVMALKYKFFNIYKKMVDANDDMEDHTSMYNVTTGALLDIISSVNVPMFSIDQEQAKKVWEKRLQEGKLKEGIKNRILKHQDELIDFFFDYSKINTKYMKEWDKLCAVRDRAYLAVYEKDWKEAIQCARKVVKMAPHEKEAHILLALALLERGREADDATARAIAEDFLDKHQGQQAPGWLLRGVCNLRAKNYPQAIIDFDQAATYFPKQQEVLNNKLNLYRKRNFLNKSKEGRMIINIYRGIMTGSGYFSPDFQKARIHIAKNSKDKARKKVFDHFFRRRLQGQWDKVLTDFQYCNSSLKTDLYEILAGEKIQLEIDSAMFTNSIIVTIHNTGNFNLHNMTVLLCVRFTDMFKGDYISFPVGETVALLKAGESVTVGRQNITDITKDKLGEKKNFKDIIDYAAVLISDEVITWIEPKKAEVVAEVNMSDIPGGNKAKASKKEIKETMKEWVNSAVEFFYYQSKDEKKDQNNERNKKVTKDLINKIVDQAVDKMDEK